MALAIPGRGRGRPGQPSREERDQDQPSEDQEDEKDVLAAQAEGFRANAGRPHPCWASPTGPSARGGRSSPAPGAIARPRPGEGVDAREGTSRRFTRSTRSRLKASRRGSACARRGSSGRGFACGRRTAVRPCACPGPASVPGHVQQRGAKDRLASLTRAAVAAEQRTGGRSGGHGSRQARQANDCRCDRTVWSHACVSLFLLKGSSGPSFNSSKKFGPRLNPTERSGSWRARIARSVHASCRPLRRIERFNSCTLTLPPARTSSKASRVIGSRGFNCTARARS